MTEIALRRLGVKHSLIPQAHDESRAQARTRELKCESCGKPVTHRAGRRPRYCSDRCRMRGFGKGRSRKTFLGADTGAPTKRLKIDSKNNAPGGVKDQSTTGKTSRPPALLTPYVCGYGQKLSDGTQVFPPPHPSFCRANPAPCLPPRIV